MEEDPKKSLEGILSGMGPAPSGSLFERLKKKEEAPPPPPPPPEEPPAPPAPPEPAVSDQLRVLEAKLAEVSEKAMAATLRLQEREQAQREMERMFQDMRAQQRSEEARYAEKEMAAKMSGRVESLEERLDKQLAQMQQAWSTLAKDLLASRDPAGTADRIGALEQEARRWREEASILRQELTAAKLELQRAGQLAQQAVLQGEQHARQAQQAAEILAQADAAQGAKDRALGENLERLALDFAQLRQEARAAAAVPARMAALEEALKTLLTRFSLAQDEAGRAGLELQRLKREFDALPAALEQRVASAESAARDRDEQRRAEGVAAAQRLEALEAWGQSVQRVLGDTAADLQTLAAAIEDAKAAGEAQAAEARARLEETARDAGARFAALHQRLAAQEDGAQKLGTGLTELEALLARTVQGLAGVQDRLAQLEAGVDVKLGTIESNAHGMMAALPEQVMERVRQELHGHAQRVDELMKRVGSMEGTTGLAIRAIPEGLLQRLRGEVARLETRLKALEAQKGG